MKESSTNAQDVDFGIFGTKEMRDVLKSKAHCLQAGFSPKHTIIITFNEIRDHYILRVGLPTYLSQMLGKLGPVQIQYCALYDEYGRRIELQLNGNHRQPVQRFIAKHFPIKSLPFRVEGCIDPNSDEIEVRWI